MPLVRAIAPSVVLFGLTVAAMIVLADEPATPQLSRPSQAVLSAISPEAGGGEARLARWINPPSRSSEMRRREALTSSDDPAED